MNTKTIEEAHDADLRLSGTALQRASQRARELAQSTGTAIVLCHDGVIEHLMPQPANTATSLQEPLAPYGVKR